MRGDVQRSREEQRRHTEQRAFPRECRLRAHYIRGLMAEAGLTQSALAEELGVGQPAVSLVVTGRRESRRIRDHIAARLGVGVRELWGLKGYVPRAVGMEITTDACVEMSGGAAGGGDPEDEPVTPAQRELIRQITARVAEQAAPGLNASRRALGRGRRG